MARPDALLDAGRLVARAPAWSLVQVRADRAHLRLHDAAGAPWADILPLACADTFEGPDEWTGVGDPSLMVDADGATVRWDASSTRWPRSTLVLRLLADRLAFRLELEGRGRLTDVRILGGRGTAWPRIGTGRHWSGRWFQQLVPGAPEAPADIAADAGRAAAVGVVGSAGPGRGRWFFTPGPLAFAATRDRPGRSRTDTSWLAIGVEVDRVEDATFTQVAYEADDNGFDVRLDYEGHTLVDGRWASPWVVLVPGRADAYDALAAIGPRAPAAGRPSRWWLEPMFCGWGAQVAVARELGVAAPALSTQAGYDGWLERLAAHGVVPGTVVVDDKWQRTYGRNEPDPGRWPDLAGWIERRHRDRQRVLLWWKAWDPEGLPAEWTIRDRQGQALAADPTNPRYAAALAEDVARMLRPRDRDGLGADGLKIDFTAATPSGAGPRTHEDGPWGIALLHRLLAIVADAARTERSDALLVTHTPSPLFADVTSMIRLNDALRLDDPHPLVPVVEQLRHRAAIVRAALPGVSIDTDDWAMPSLAEWRRWQRAKQAEGVPALYHVDGLGSTDERLGPEDLALVAREWAAYRDRTGLPPRP